LALPLAGSDFHFDGGVKGASAAHFGVQTGVTRGQTRPLLIMSDESEHRRTLAEMRSLKSELCAALGHLQRFARGQARAAREPHDEVRLAWDTPPQRSFKYGRRLIPSFGVSVMSSRPSTITLEVGIIEAASGQPLSGVLKGDLTARVQDGVAWFAGVVLHLSARPTLKRILALRFVVSAVDRDSDAPVRSLVSRTIIVHNRPTMPTRLGPIGRDMFVQPGRPDNLPRGVHDVRREADCGSSMASPMPAIDASSPTASSTAAEQQRLGSEQLESALPDPLAGFEVSPALYAEMLDMLTDDEIEQHLALAHGALDEPVYRHSTWTRVPYDSADEDSTDDESCHFDAADRWPAPVPRERGCADRDAAVPTRAATGKGADAETAVALLARLAVRPFARMTSPAGARDRNAAGG
jgi:hypothetical protein